MASQSSSPLQETSSFNDVSQWMQFVMQLAMERGEVEGLCTTTQSFRNFRPDWVKSGGVSPVGRTTFLLRDAYQGDEKLLQSGLLGPVTVQMNAFISIK